MASKKTIFCQFPVSLIKDVGRREEFLKEYQRFSGRCGYNAMLTTFNLYLLEQAIERSETPAPGTNGQPILRTVGYKNTSEIIARFVENGWMEFYLSDVDVLKKSPLLMTLCDYVLISQCDGGKPNPSILTMLLKTPSKRLTDFVEGYLRELREEATYISPDRIREVFAEIDARFDSCETRYNWAHY